MIKKWTESEIEILKTLLKEGKTYAEMSTVLGKTDRGIQHFIYKKNLLYNPLTQKKITNKTVQELLTNFTLLDLDDIKHSPLFDETLKTYYSKALKQYKNLAKESPVAMRMIPRLVMIEALLDKAIVLCSQLQGTEEKSALLGHIEKFTKIYLTLSEGLKVLPKQKDKDDIDDIAKSKELSAYAFYKQAKKKSINMQPKNEKEETALLHKKIEEMEL